MKIANSSVAMESERRFSSVTSTETMSIETRNGEQLINDIRSLAAEEGSDLVSGMRLHEQNEWEAQQKQQKQNQARAFVEYMDRTKQMRESGNQFRINDDVDMQIKLLRKLLAALSGKGRLNPFELEQARKSGILDLRSNNLKRADQSQGIAIGTNGTSTAGQAEGINLAGSVTALQIGTTAAGTLWHRVTATSGFHSESEMTTFKSTGLVTTQDGRSINFGVEVNMSRAFMEKVDILSDQTYYKTDPLMINLDTNVGSVSDVKFTFDLDADGRKENISFAGKGSGFLALDKNDNGRIDDGTELFGTQSGDGFADLAAYDTDGNNWIDENDDIFSRLKVWIKDEEGNDKLLDLKEADVGAIYLGNAATEFSLKNEDNVTNGIIQKTGIYLKESGGVSTVNHVDLTL